MYQKYVFNMFRSRICRFHFETDKELGTDFELYDMNDGTIPQALNIENNYWVLRYQFQRGVILIQKTTV